MTLFSSFGIGALHFGSSIDKSLCKQIVYKALDLGISFFDTSPLYGNSHSEEVLGEICADLPQPVFIATKVGLKASQRKDGKFGVEVIPLTEKNLRESVENSLRKLKRTQIDLLMLHAFDAKTPLAETLDALIALHREGKIRFFGCSNYNPQQLKTLLREVDKKSCRFLVAAQCHYNMVERRAENAFIPLCDKHEIRVIVNRALARGALSGQYTVLNQYPTESRAAKSWRVRNWLKPERLALLETLSRLSSQNKLSLTEVALIWLKKKYPNSLPLLGVRNVEQLVQCATSGNRLLEDALFNEIETLIDKEPHVYSSPPRYFEK